MFQFMGCKEITLTIVNGVVTDPKRLIRLRDQMMEQINPKHAEPFKLNDEAADRRPSLSALHTLQQYGIRLYAVASALGKAVQLNSETSLREMWPTITRTFKNLESLHSIAVRDRAPGNVYDMFMDPSPGMDAAIGTIRRAVGDLFLLAKSGPYYEDKDKGRASVYEIPFPNHWASLKSLCTFNRWTKHMLFFARHAAEMYACALDVLGFAPGVTWLVDGHMLQIEWTENFGVSYTCAKKTTDYLLALEDK